MTVQMLRGDLTPGELLSLQQAGILTASEVRCALGLEDISPAAPDAQRYQYLRDDDDIHAAMGVKSPAEMDRAIDEALRKRSA